MTKLLAEAIEAVQKLPDVLQDEVAALMLQAAGREADPAILTPEQWAEVEAAIAEEGDDATQEELGALYARWRG